MSQENVDLVLALQPGPGVDLVPRIRDDDASAAWQEAVTPYFHPDFECAHRLLGAQRTYFGMDGLRESWRDWLAPWVAYRSDVVEAIDCGDRVLMIVNDFGRREDSPAEIRSNNAAIWTIREGKVACAEFYADRARARKDVGLAE
jgi:ketosteroid isomerase-like protein